MARRKRGFFAELEHQRRQRELAEKRFLAEQDRLARQHAREQDRAAREQVKARAQSAREEQAQHIQQQQAEAAALKRMVTERAAELDGLLLNGVADPGTTTFAQLRQTFVPQPFDAAGLDSPDPAPQWQQFAPEPPTGLGRVFGKAGYERAVHEANARFARATADHQARERDRLAALAKAKAEHDLREATRRQETERNNTQVDELEQQVRAHVPQAVEEYFELIVEAAPLPPDLPTDVETAYQPEPRKLLITRDLPNLDVIPADREYTYVRARNEITAKPRPVKEIRERYAGLVAQIVLHTMHRVFSITPKDVVDEVAVNGHVPTRNKATGQPERPCLVSVSATREQFNGFILDELEPADCLRHLNALVSPHPWDLEPVRPIFDPDLSKYRIVDAHDAASGLDARPVLLDMRPFEFEVLVKQLFEAMGMKSWVTQGSRDDGVDAVAVNPDPIMGGVCVIQAKRYSKVVPVDAVRALAGVMEDKRASRGVLVTTSWFGKATYDFAGRHERIQLIDGPQLVHQLAEYLNLNVIVGQLRGRPA